MKARPGTAGSASSVRGGERGGERRREGAERKQKREQRENEKNILAYYKTLNYEPQYYTRTSKSIE